MSFACPALPVSGDWACLDGKAVGIPFDEGGGLQGEFPCTISNRHALRLLIVLAKVQEHFVKTLEGSGQNLPRFLQGRWRVRGKGGLPARCLMAAGEAWFSVHRGGKR